MVQQCHACGVLAANNLGFGLARSAKRTWHVQNQPHRAFITLQHHSLDPYGRNEMGQQCHAFYASCKQPWFSLDGSG
jgi:hypothetical protein